MSFRILRPQVKTLLQTVSKLQEVSGTPSLKFNGYPACYVIPSDNSSDYETTSENIRVYAFIVRVFYETKDTGVANALIAMEDLIDTILDTFDKEDFRDSTTRTVGIGLPTGYTFLNILAHPSSWGELPDENLIMVELSIKVRVSIDVNNT
jgi:hypothetical protein